jgi:hypothetical protein
MRKLVGLTRYTVFVPAIASILGALAPHGSGVHCRGGGHHQLGGGTNTPEGRHRRGPHRSGCHPAGDVLLVIGYGLYELFVDTELDVPAWLQIKDLDDLKSKLIGVVVAIIAVVFVGVLVDSTRAGDVLAYGAGAGAVVLGLGVFAWATRKSASPDKR